MNIEEYHKMRKLETTYWWFRARRKMILTLLDKISREELRNRQGNLRVLDVGCGTGMLMEDMKALGFVCGVDFSPVALTFCRERGLTNLVRANVEKLPITTNHFDLVTALDLVEHVPDDRALIGELYRVLRPGGIALMTVPAHPSLWSMHDVALHHQRRYEKKAFRSLIENSGFELLRYSYMMASIYPFAATYRQIKKRLGFSAKQQPHTDEFPLPRWLNTTLKAIASSEAYILKRWDIPWGLSLVSIARKPGK
jgi:ubiquinone/menaquinone biosynthesis C-methylase UbiE